MQLTYEWFDLTGPFESASIIMSTYRSEETDETDRQNPVLSKGHHDLKVLQKEPNMKKDDYAQGGKSKNAFFFFLEIRS